MSVNDIKEPLNILLVSHRFYKDSKAGTETLVEDVAIELKRRGYNIYIMAVSNDAEDDKIQIYFRYDGICFISIPYFFQNGIVDNWKKLEILQTKRIEYALNKLSVKFHIVHIFHFARIGLEFFKLNIFRDSKLFITLTDYSVICPDYQLYNKKQNRICNNIFDAECCVNCVGNNSSNIMRWRRRNIEFINTFANVVYTQTITQREIIIKAGIKKDIVSLLTAAYQIPLEWDKLYTTHKKQYMFGYFGRISPEKGLHIFLKAYLESKLKEYNFLICGSFDDNERYNSYIKYLIRRSKKITICEPVSLNELGQVMLSVNNIVFPSIWNENHSVLLTYACALGINVFASNVPALRELKYPQITLVNNYMNPACWESTIMGRVYKQTNYNNLKNISSFQKAFYCLIDSIEKSYIKSINGE